MINIIGGSHPAAKYLIKRIKNKDKINIFSSKNNYQNRTYPYEKTYEVIKDDDILISFSNIYITSLLIKNLSEKNIIPSKIILISSSSIYSKIGAESIDSSNYINFQKGEEKIKNLSYQILKNTQVIILRTTMIWGDLYDKNINQVYKFLNKYRFFPINTKSYGLRAPIHNEDLAIIIEKIIDFQFDKFNIFDVHGKEIIKYKDMINLIRKHSLRKFTFLLFVPHQFIVILTNIFNPMPDISLFKKLKSILGVLKRQSEDLVYTENDFLNIYCDYEKLSFDERLKNTYRKSRNKNLI
mgnify:CR=1 FL=1